MIMLVMMVCVVCGMVDIGGVAVVFVVGGGYWCGVSGVVVDTEYDDGIVIVVVSGVDVFAD